jgi:signal transduction histidine kinase
MNEPLPPDEPQFLLATLPPTPGQRRLAVAIVVVLLVAFVAMLPFAGIELAPVNAFIPSLETALPINDLITSALLFAQFAIMRQRALLVLASGYLFSAFIVIPHALTFPGAFSPAGLLGAGSQTSAWLYIFWHAALPLAVIVYAIWKDAGLGTATAQESPRAEIAMSVVAVIVLVCGLTWLAVAGEHLLPRLLPDATHVTAWGQFLTGALVALGVVALVLLWLRRRSALDLWLLVMMCALLPEAALTAFLTVPRFSLGFYAARVFSLITSSVVLIVLLAQTTALYARLARSIIMQRRESEARQITMNTITASIAHEVNQPLAAVVANANAGLRWLANATPDLEEVRAALTRIVNAGLHAGKVIESTRSIFKRDRGRRARIDLNELISHILVLDSRDLQVRGVSLQLEFERLPAVTADRVQLQQVLLNLIKNAADAMDAVTDRARVLKVKSEVVDPDGIMVSVEDTGTGIAPKDAERIFDAFFTTKADGTGMGLAICRSIIEAHDGRLWASPRVPHGSVFQFTLPTSKSGEESMAA